MVVLVPPKTRGPIVDKIEIHVTLTPLNATNGNMIRIEVLLLSLFGLKLSTDEDFSTSSHRDVIRKSLKTTGFSHLFRHKMTHLKKIIPNEMRH